MKYSYIVFDNKNNNYVVARFGILNHAIDFKDMINKNEFDKYGIKDRYTMIEIDKNIEDEIKYEGWER